MFAAMSPGGAGAAGRAGGGRARHVLVAAALVSLAGTAYEGVRHLGSLGYDDDLFVTQNPWIRSGLGWWSLAWALRADLVYDSPHADYYAPLTVFSRILDVQLFGMSAGGHHLTNLVFHAANVVLAFFVLRALTGAVWPSAFAAGLLAVHPLHVESVAWGWRRRSGPGAPPARRARTTSRRCGLIPRTRAPGPRCRCRDRRRLTYW